MLYVATKENKNLQWEIGDSTNKILSVSDDIQTIMACGKELDLIKNTFRLDLNIQTGYSIPMPMMLSDVVWHGDLAKTIISNVLYC
jgi:hypothetical protein